MGIINWLMHRNMRGHAQSIAKWAVESFEALRAQNPDIAQRDIFAKMLDKHMKFPGGDKEREVFLDP